MKQKNVNLSRKIVQDITMWTILIFSLLILNSSKVFGQCNCDDEQVTTVSLGASEGFESYNANQVMPIGGRWSLFASAGYNPVAATVVSTPVNCGSRSLRFQYNVNNPVDMKYLIDPKRTSFKMYVPSGKGGTFSLLAGDGQLSVLELQFGTSGNCTVNNGESFSYPQGSWFRISIIRIGNSFQIFRNYDHVSTFGTITEVDYANFDANALNEQFYIDKLCTYFYNGAQVNCTLEYNPQCLNLSNIPAGNNDCEAMVAGYIASEFSSCGSTNNSPCTNATPISCGQTINGTTIGENFKFYRPDFGSCLGGSNSNDFRAPDKVYSFNHTGGDAQIHLWTSTPNVDLDIFLLSECGAAWSDNPVIVINNVPPNTNNPNITCIERGISTVDASGFDTEYIFVKNLPAGTYYIVVDGQHWQNAGQTDDVGSFKLSLHCNDLVCTNPGVLRCGDKLINESNANGANNVSIYCGPSPNIAGSTLPLPSGAGCTGRERVYTFTPDVNGEVTVNVTGIGSSENFDAFVFLSCDHTNCLAVSTNGYGQSEVLTFDGEAGRQYIIVIDGYQETTGNYDIEIVCPSTVICEFCPVFVPSYTNCAGFENLNTGNLIPQASPQFSLFTSNNTSHQAQVVNAFAANGLKSVKFGNTSNIDYNISRTITSPTRIEWMMYIPTGKSGAWGLETNSASVYAFIARYNNGTLNVVTPTQSSGEVQVASLQYPQNTWFKVSIIIKPKIGTINGSIEIFNNRQFVHKRTDFGSNQITDLNFYSIANTTNTDYHIDNICYQESNALAPCTQEYNPVCVNGQVYSNPCFARKAGYTENEWQLGDCTGDYCDGCLKCFKYIPKYGTPRAINFFSQYCDNDEPTHLRSSYTAEWTVSNNANVQYVDNTTSTSLNPVILFPSNGSYTVCYKLFFGGLLVYECCQTIVIGPCNGGPIAYFAATNNASNSTFTLNSSGSTNVSNIKWEFSDTGVQFITGNVNSTSPVISIPSGKCISVCLIISNGCGMSTYCLKLCRNNSACSGTVPPVYITNQITPVLNDKTVTISLPNPGNNQATYSWKFGDGATSTSQSINYTYPNYGNYIICVEIRIGCFVYCYCWCIHLNPCTPVFEPHDGMLRPRFGGNETTLQYTIESNNITIAPGQPWLLDDVPVTNSTGAANLTIALPQDRDYVICFPYLKPNGCLAYKCITIRGGNPFSCTNIGWKYVQNSGYQFSLPAGFSEISWILDETGQSIGTTATSNFVLPVNPCGWRTISVRYFDGTRYWICCLRIYLCAPDDCFGNVYYGSSNDNAQFRLEEAEATNISWYFDDTPNTVLGTSATIIVPYPINCVERWITVKYRDASGRWRVCCRLIWFCNPFNCNQIKVTYTEGSGFRFELDQTYQNMSWVIDETNQALGSGVQSNFYPISGTECFLRTATVRYRDALGRWWICCYRFWWCNPANCNDKITITPSGSNYILSTDNTAQNITWFRENVQLGTGNNLTTSLPSTGTYKIYIRYYNPSNKAWYWCCKSFTPGGSSSTLTFDLDDNVCGAINQTIDIPIRVKNFSKVSSFQFSLKINDAARADIISIEKGNVSGDLNTGLISTSSATVTWDNPSAAIDLADNSIVMIVKVRLKSSFTGSSAIVIINTPTAISAEQNNIEVIPTVIGGSYCIGATAFKLCGKITREDNVTIANVVVTLSGGKNSIATTNSNGEYCFEDLQSNLNYVITPSKNTNHVNGVNTGDVTAIRRHILSLEKLNSPYKIIAADANASKAVNTGDVTEIRRLILSLISQFTNSESWAFIPTSHVFSDPANPFSSAIPSTVNITNLNSNVTDLNFIGVKIGDVNLSNNPSNVTESVSNRSAADINIVVGSANVIGNQNFDIDIKVKQFKEIVAGQFSINWDKTLADFVSIKNMNTTLGITNDNFNTTQAGKTGFIWDSPTPVTLSDDTRLFTISLKSKSLKGTGPIEITNDPVSRYFQNKDGVELNIIITNGSLTVPTDDILKNGNIRIYPNPTTGLISIESDFKDVKNIEIRGLDGKLIQMISELRDNTLDLTHLAPGSYILKGVTNNYPFAKKVVIVR